MSKTLLVFASKTFKITVPDEAKITFGPWSPQSEGSKYGQSEKALNGTLRIYESTKSGASVLAVFSGVTGYRDMAIDYEEQVVVEQGSTIWRSDRNGYKREDVVKRDTGWLDPTLAIGAGPEKAEDF